MGEMKKCLCDGRDEKMFRKKCLCDGRDEKMFM